MTSLNDYFGVFARTVNLFASSPAATALVFILVALWVSAGPNLHYSESWQLLMNTLSSVTTFLMVFVLNNAQSRDTAAINAKLDSLIFAMSDADNRLIGLESKSDSHAKAVLDDIKENVLEAEEALSDAEELVSAAESQLKNVDAVLEAEKRNPPA